VDAANLLPYDAQREIPKKMVQCPSCARQQEPRLICSQCGAPLVTDLDLFAALGLPRLLQVDTAALESSYHDLGRRIHPDHFASATAEVRDASLRATALLTRAYRTLRDPISRGLYWLELFGHKLGENNNQVPPDLAELVFEVQEQLSELRNSEADESAARQCAIDMTTTRARLQGLVDELYAELIENFAGFDAGGGPNPNELFAELKSILSKIAYLRTLLRDVDRELECVKAE
jgi:molecular chaperone HscB